MKLHHYHMTFRNALSPEQEERMMGCVKGMLEQMEAKYRKGANSFRNDPKLKIMFRLADPAIIQTLTSKLDGLLVERDGYPLFWSYYKLEHKEANRYVFTAPDPDELMGVAGAMASFPKPLVTLFKTLIAGDKDATMKWLHATITKELKVEEGGYKITLVKEV